MTDELRILAMVQALLLANFDKMLLNVLGLSNVPKRASPQPKILVMSGTGLMCVFRRCRPWIPAHAGRVRQGGVTRLLLWQEYKAHHPGGLQYSAFCDHFRACLHTAEPVMR